MKQERMTKKDSSLDYIVNTCCKEGGHYTERDIVSKLGQIEDIEEELGIDVVTLVKALKNGIYTYDYDLHKKINEKVNIIHCSCDLDINIYQELRLLPILKKECYRKGYHYIKPIALGMVSLKEYGKTWALTKEELENE